MRTKLHSGLDGPRLLQMLGEALHKQKTAWRPFTYRPNTNSQAVEVGPQLRDEIVQWLTRLRRQFQFNPETLALSVALLDRFLQSVKARPKYLRCIGISCFYLAAKVLEESEMVPGASEIVQETDCGCTRAELLRMERVILDKLQWDLKRVTTLDFLHIFHALLLCQHPHLLDSVRTSPSRQLSLLTHRYQLCLASHRLLAYSPATQALALLSLELELFRTDYLHITVALQTLAQVDSDKLIGCRETMAQVMSPDKNNPVYMFSPSASIKPGKRKVEQVEQEAFFDGIKRLYNDEASDTTLSTSSSSSSLTSSVAAMTTCGTEARLDTSSLPPLTTVAN